MAIPLHPKQVISAEKPLMSQVCPWETLATLVGEKWVFANKEDEK